MYSNIQSYQKKLTTKFWKGQETKRRNSNINIKKEDSICSNPTSTLNYDITEEKIYIDEWLATLSSADRQKESKLARTCLEICTKDRPSRTLRLPTIDPLDRTNPRLELFLQSYTKSFVYLKSKHEGCNQKHLVSLPAEVAFSEIPVYEIDQDYLKTCQTPASNAREFSELWQSQSLDRIQSDPLITGLLNGLSSGDEEIQSLRMRQRHRQRRLFPFYGRQEPDKLIEVRPEVDFPRETLGKSFKVEIHSFNLEPDLEPIFGHICFYDLKNRMKISENFYFDFNDASKFRMLDPASQTQFMERSPVPTSCVFHVSQTSDIYLIIRIEKILQQGEINEIADAYLKDDKHKSKLKAQIEWSCLHLAKYRMPFGIIAMELSKLMNSSNRPCLPFLSSSSIDSCSVNSRTSSVKIPKTPTGMLRKNPLEGSCSKATSRSISKDMHLMNNPNLEEEEFDSQYQNMLLSKTHIKYLFRQDADRVSDEDIFKWLLDTKKSSNNGTGGSGELAGTVSVASSGSGVGGPGQKKMKPIPCSMDLEISPIDELDSDSLILSPEQVPLANRHQRQSIGRAGSHGRPPIVDVLELGTERRCSPHVAYRNLLYVYPKSLNFSSRPSSQRNITIRVQLLYSDGEKTKPLKLIYNQCGIDKFSTEAFTKVLYHNRTPEFNDEVKIQLPGIVTPSYFLLFSFYHISCQPNKKIDNGVIEQLIGYSWLPLVDDGQIMRGAEHSLMVSLDRPNPIQASKKPDSQANLENIRWLENHKDIFRVLVCPVSSTHSDEAVIEGFLSSMSTLRHRLSSTGSSSAGVVPGIGENDDDDDASSCDSDLDDRRSGLLDQAQQLWKPECCQVESVLQFSGVLLDSLLWLALDCRQRLGRAELDSRRRFLDVCARLVNRISAAAASAQTIGQSRLHNRHPDLATYALHAASLPHTGLDETNIRRYLRCQMDIEKRRSTPIIDDYKTKPEAGFYYALLHEELLFRILECMETSEPEAIFENIWFFLELLIRTMREFYRVATAACSDSNCSGLFSMRFVSGLEKLVCLSSHHLEKCLTDGGSSPRHHIVFLVRNLGLFIADLITLIDTGLVMTLVCSFVSAMNSCLSTRKGSETDRVYVFAKLEFLRIVCASEYFLAISNVDPTMRTSTYLDPVVAATATTAVRFVEPFLLGLVFRELKMALLTSDADIQSTAVHLLWNLCASHESDSRYTDPVQAVGPIANLYLPLVPLLFDCVQSPGIQSPQGGLTRPANDSCSLSSVDGQLQPTGQSQATSLCALDCIDEGPSAMLLSEPAKQHGLVGDSETCKHLLLCFVWLLKNLSVSRLTNYIQNLSPLKVNRILYLLSLAVVNFEYKGSKDTASQMKSEGSQSSFIEINFNSEIRKRATADKTNCATALFGKLCMEVIFVVLDTLDLILKVFESSVHSSLIVTNCFKIVIKSLGLNQSVAAIQCLLSFQRLLLKKHHQLIFDEAIDLSAELSRTLLRLASSDLKEVRSHAVASLYMLMRFNFVHENSFARVKLQLTTALSRMVYSSREDGNASGRPQHHQQQWRASSMLLNLNRSLRTLVAYSSVEMELSTDGGGSGSGDADVDWSQPFPRQVIGLAANLHAILTDTVRMRRHEGDPEMQLDLMSCLAHRYRNSPDLRLAWLQMMKDKHIELKNEEEAGMCLAHCAALVAEYLGMLEPVAYLPVGCVTLASALDCPNLLQESAVHDDAVSPGIEDGVCCDPLFSADGLLRLVRSACRHFSRARMFELVPRLLPVLLPMLQKNRDFQTLSRLHEDMRDAYLAIQKEKRIYATYFRVGFYGLKFNEMNGNEYIYKEAPFTKLPEISSNIEKFYAERFNNDSIQIIKDSNSVNPSDLSPDKLNIQITYVEPYFELTELNRRQTDFERNYNIRKFVYSTPYTLNGRAHGDLREQYMRKTVLFTEVAFPFLKRRIAVQRKLEIQLAPVQVALEDLTRKVDQLAATLSEEPVDLKYLQMMLQGSLGPTVNQGPLELAHSFLTNSDARSTTGVYHHKLRLCFKEFLRRCREGLDRNRLSLNCEHQEYQVELEKNYHAIEEQLQPLLTQSRQ